MKRALSTVLLTLACLSTAAAQAPREPGTLSSQTERLQSEVLITNLATPDLTRAITAENGRIDHMSEVTRGGPVAAVVRTAGCQKELGQCRVNADIVIYRPDGSVFHEVKNLDLPQGRAAVPLKMDAQSATGVYRVEATVRDVAARRFAKVERQFGVK